jgi:quercetin dioxygenase-like cupin family protein
MNIEKITTSYVDAEKYPWIPFSPYSDVVFIKVLKVEPVSGTFVTLLKAPAGMQLPKHHHCGTVMVYTVKGQWRYIEHDWTAAPGSFVYETAASVHTPVVVGGDEVITLNVQVGDSLYMDDKDNIIAVENWKSVAKRHIDFHKARGLAVPDVADFTH